MKSAPIHFPVRTAPALVLAAAMTLSMAAAVDVSSACMLTGLPSQSRLATGNDRQSLTQWINRLGDAMQHLGLTPKADWSGSHTLLNHQPSTAMDPLALQAQNLCRWGTGDGSAPSQPPIRAALINLPPPLES